MDLREHLLPWLQEKLEAERTILQEQHYLLQREMYEKHKQLIAEMEATLRDHSVKQQQVDSLAPHSAEGDECIQSAPAETVTIKEKETPSFDTASAPHAYKSDVLKILAGDRKLGSQSWLQRKVNSPAFEALTGSIIIINTIILACEVEYHGFDSGHAVGYKSYMPSDEKLPGARAWFNRLDTTFVILFTGELFARIAAFGKRSVHSPWIWFDTIIVAVSWLAIVFSSDNDSLDPTFMRMCRLARMVRAFKLIQTVKAFDSLYLLIKSIQASVGALFWSFVVLIFVQVAVGLCISQMLRQYIQNGLHDIEDRRAVFLYYGTFSRTMVTMFEITLVNWAPSCRTLMNNVSEYFGLFYVLYSCCFIFAVIRVIQAVFIAETNRVVAADDQIAIRRKQQDSAIYLKKLQIMFDELDESGDGILTRGELQQVVDDKLLRALMSTLGINVYDLETLFHLLDNGSGEIAIEDFVQGLSRLKGSAQSIDLVPLIQAANTLDRKFDIMMELMSTGRQPIESQPRMTKMNSVMRIRSCRRNSGSTLGSGGVVAAPVHLVGANSHSDVMKIHGHNEQRLHLGSEPSASESFNASTDNAADPAADARSATRFGQEGQLAL